MKLYSFPTSSASYRVRIALHLKGIPFETVTVNMPKKEQREAAYRKINPQNRVPALELDDGTILTQSLAIIDYLEQIRPAPSVYPADPVMRAKALAVAIAIASEIQPINNSSVTDYVREKRGLDQAALDAWIAHFMRAGLAAVEQLIEGAAIASATNRPLPTSAWCRRCSTLTASRSTSPIFPRSTRWRTSPTPIRPLPRRIPAGSPASPEIRAAAV